MVDALNSVEWDIFILAFFKKSNGRGSVDLKAIFKASYLDDKKSFLCSLESSQIKAQAKSSQVIILLAWDITECISLGGGS